MKSESFNLSKPMLSLLEKHGITIATPVQQEIIPGILAGRDILAQSETGSGKTISFAVPILEHINQQDGLCALVLVPTRELCMQVAGEFSKFSQGKRLGVTAVYGGASINDQIRKIRKTNVVVATPGRLIDLLNRKEMRLDKIRFLVFDEADRMLDMGFIPDVERILKHIPQNRQTMLFSATVSKEIAKLSQKYLKNPLSVSFASEVTPEFLRQTYYQISQDQKLPLLVHLLKHERDLALVFCNRKHITSKLANKLIEQGVNAKCLHGDMSQSQRERVTADFRKKRFSVLIATDVASRGLHIEDISHVYNYEIPKDVESYTHRIGRTARAGKKGEAISFVSGGEDQKFFKQILFEHRGSISLKSVDGIHLPKSSAQPPKHENKFRDKNKPYPDRKSPAHNDNKFNRSDEEKPKTFGEKKPGGFDKSKSKYWDKKKSRPFDKSKAKPYIDNSTETFVEKKSTGYGKGKPKYWDKKKPNSYGKTKSTSAGKGNPGTWEERKPKFWVEKKAKTWRDKLVKMIGK